ncbi:hypothetical protein JOF41_001240 [Saccharothrix coeruleofusca]|uniref:hypothetical protein n=1 Tax=Saccharothrix coeruleofusca TaxID=33919 RepID=UPI001AE6E4F1|nr:hypothetical protein [Saccharothrix coeruleofusca]MBP2335062.1 hypothetical protein [Saccharothrix coeruleofusca]
MLNAHAHPVYRIALGVDIEGSTTRSNREKPVLREVMYEIIAEALARHGIGDDVDRLVDRGDGALALIRPSDRVPKTLLLGSVVPELSRLLTRHNTRRPEVSMRLRAVVHAGEVHFDERGQFGELLDVACGLLDAPRLKLALRETSAPLVLVVSDELYWSVVHHGYDSIAVPSFAPLVNIQVGPAPRQGWVHVPGEPTTWQYGPVRGPVGSPQRGLPLPGVSTVD